MSLSQKEIETLINLHLEKADSFLSQADEMCNLNHWDLATNRYYYACFHIIHALFVANGIVAHTHDGLVSLFGKEFVQKGKVDKELGRFMSRMEQLRKLADYNCVASVSAEEVTELKEPAHKLFTQIKTILNK